ncbi:MAG TPA: asparagine synthase (glutamine-hydrolyzing) [Ktedonobacteraceae bacterium]
MSKKGWRSMCGIAGWVDWEKDLTQQRSTVEAMNQAIAHRGPDAQGCWFSPRAALSNRRLYVIDPQGGGQPMLYQNQGQLYVLTYNGEIYNFRELREELRKHGHVFSTHSDTEVLLHAYVKWGVNCVTHLNGMFAFALWDEQEQRLLLARDHLGIKPLFYAQRGSALLFGSELKALLAHPLVSAEIDDTGLAEIFGFRRAPGSGVFRSVHELRPGHRLLYTREQLKIERYWQLSSEPHIDDLETTAEKVRALLIDDVRRQLCADVPVVTMLSGGLDSSALTVLTAREFQRQGKPLHTYSIDFADNERYFEDSELRPDLDEPWVQLMSDAVKSHHHTITVDTSELLEAMLVPMRAHDLPAGGQMEISLYLLCKAMKKNATVALSGEAADDVFAGYPWFYSEEALNASTFPWLATMEHYASCGGAFSSPWLSAEVEQRVKPGEYSARIYEQTLAEVPRLEGEDPRQARIRELLYLSLVNWLALLLDRKDRMSAAVGFEVRVPYCDYRLVEYAWNIPWEMKNTGQIEKGILRHALRGLLPEEVRTRRKSAYPVTCNPEYIEATRAWAQQIVEDPGAPLRPFLNLEHLRQLLAHDHLCQSEGRATLYERIIQLNAWLHEYHVTVV